MSYTRRAMKLSVVIPTLDEAENVGALLKRLSRTPGVSEVVVSDGGSTDGTREIVGASRARLVGSEPGRGAQLRAGARRASGDVFLFLHADVVPPRDLAEQIAGAIEEGCVGGTSGSVTRGAGPSDDGWKRWRPSTGSSDATTAPRGFSSVGGSTTRSGDSRGSP